MYGRDQQDWQGVRGSTQPPTRPCFPSFAAAIEVTQQKPNSTLHRAHLGNHQTKPSNRPLSTIRLLQPFLTPNRMHPMLIAPSHRQRDKTTFLTSLLCTDHRNMFGCCLLLSLAINHNYITLSHSLLTIPSQYKRFVIVSQLKYHTTIDQATNHYITIICW